MFHATAAEREAAKAALPLCRCCDAIMVMKQRDTEAQSPRAAVQGSPVSGIVFPTGHQKVVFRDRASEMSVGVVGSTKNSEGFSPVLAL